jgi:hypothetical protein
VITPLQDPANCEEPAKATVEDLVEATTSRPFGAQSTTALRAAAAACGRSGNLAALHNLRANPELPLSVLDECNWWISLPRYAVESAGSDLS